MKDVSKLDVSLSFCGIARTAMVRACIMAPLALLLLREHAECELGARMVGTSRASCMDA